LRVELRDQSGSIASSTSLTFARSSAFSASGSAEQFPFPSALCLGYPVVIDCL